MREFKLIDSNGTELNITEVGMFFHLPSGLGFDENIQSERIGSTYICTDSFLMQKSPTGEMVFHTYEQYQTFVEFVSDKVLTLCYKPTETWYYLKCRVQSLGKSEIDHTTNRLVCPITFLALSTWYEAITSIPSRKGDVDTKIYPYPYGYSYGSGALRVCQISNGAIESPCRISILGQSTNPSWKLYKGAKLLMEGKVNVSIANTQKLVIDSTPDNMEIAIYTLDDEFVSDAYQLSDFSTQRFIYLPSGDCKISFIDVADCFVEVKKLAYSV